MSPGHGRTTTAANCSFCQKPNTEVHRLVAGPGVFICDGCVAVAAELVAGGGPSVPRRGVLPWDGHSSLDEVLGYLGPVAAAGQQVERNLGAWVAKARSLGGTWSQIGQALGMTRQSAWERFARDE